MATASSLRWTMRQSCTRSSPLNPRIISQSVRCWRNKAGIAWNPASAVHGRGYPFSSTSTLSKRQSLDNLPDRRAFRLKDTPAHELLCLEWSQPPCNLLLIKKEYSDEATEALIEFSRHVTATYPGVNILLEPKVSAELGHVVSGDHFSPEDASLASRQKLQDKVDLVVTFGGDGTILHASSMFATSPKVPPILSFSMGTLGFLSEWKFSEYKRAFREVYMSGASSERHAVIQNASPSEQGSITDCTGWSSIRGMSMGPARGSRVLVRQRLKVGLFDSAGKRLGNGDLLHDLHAMNEMILHRGQDPHLAIVDVFVGGRFLTEAVADGIIISTPTGSTAYSLSSGGSIIHPLVPSLLLTPICPRSLSFRPLVLPATTPLTLKLSEKNRGREVEFSIDGKRHTDGIGVGTEVRVSGEDIRNGPEGFVGGIPCIMRRTTAGTEGDDGWVGGLNGLLKFNYPFGEES
ncbi:NADH kinase pos5, mitochondrial [Exophiala dermatitidis]